MDGGRDGNRAGGALQRLWARGRRQRASEGQRQGGGSREGKEGQIERMSEKKRERPGDKGGGREGREREICIEGGKYGVVSRHGLAWYVSSCITRRPVLDTCRPVFQRLPCVCYAPS